MNQNEQKNVDYVLQQLSSNPNELISRESLLRFLDQRSNQLYDRIIFEQLYARMPKGINGCVSINDFKTIIQQAYQSLIQKISISEKALEQKQKELNSTSIKLQQLSNTERYNNNNISLESTLTVQVLDGTIQFPGNSQVYVTVGCEDVFYKTRLANRNSALWNDTFTFPIQSGQEEVWLVLLDEELAQKREIGGQIRLSLQDYQDQQIHEVELVLKDKYDVIQYSTIRVAIQWIHSQTKYLEAEIIQLQTQIAELKFDIDEFKSDIRSIFQPFQVKQEKSQDPQVYSTHFKQTDKENVEMTPTQWLKLSIIITLIFFITSIACCFIKAEYLDFIILFYTLWFYMNNYELKSLLHIKIISGMLIISLCYDGFWIYIFSAPYLENKVKYDHPDDTFHQYTVTLCILIVIEKICILISFIKLYVSCPKERENIFDEQYEICFGRGYTQSNELPKVQYTSKIIRQSIPNTKYIYPTSQQQFSSNYQYY